MSRKKLTLSVDPMILEAFRESYEGSISSFLDGCMAQYLTFKEGHVGHG